jgi:hypothetical protein
MSQRISAFRFDRFEEPLFRTGQEPCNQTFLPGSYTADKSIVTAINPLDLELLPGFNPILSADFRRENDLTFAADLGCHSGKISSYHKSIKDIWDHGNEKSSWLVLSAEAK